MDLPGRLHHQGFWDRMKLRKWLAQLAQSKWPHAIQKIILRDAELGDLHLDVDADVRESGTLWCPNREI